MCGAVPVILDGSNFDPMRVLFLNPCVREKKKRPLSEESGRL